LFGCRFFQSGGLFGSVFNFVQIDDYEDGQLRTTWYNTDGTQSAANNYLSDVEVDRVSIFQHGGRTSIVPGVKYALRDYKLQRNYLENVTANNANPLDVTFGDIWPKNNRWQRISLKFNLKYKILDIPPTAGVWAYYTDDIITFKPIFRLVMSMDLGAKSYTWSHAAVDRSPLGIKASSSNIGRYRDLMLGTYTWWNYYIGQGWVDHDVFTQEVRYFEILNDEATWVDESEVTGGTYPLEEKIWPVELITNAPGGLSPNVMKNLRVQLELQDLYNSHFPQWMDIQSPGEDPNDYVEWSVDDFELIIHSDDPGIEESPQTGIKYRATSPDAYRRTETLSDCGIVNFDSRALNAVKILDPFGQWGPDELWYRGTDDTDLLDLNKMSVREAIAMSKRGLYFWQGKIIDRGSGSMKFLRSIQLRGVRHLIVQAKWEARMNEWSSIYLLEVARNQTGITIEEYTSDKSTGSNIGSSGGNITGGNGTANIPPQYEFASGITASAFEPDIDMGGYASASDNDINTKLWVFQDATKLHYPTGYDIDFVNNLIIPTDEFEDSNIELYLFN